MFSTARITTRRLDALPALSPHGVIHRSVPCSGYGVWHGSNPNQRGPAADPFTAGPGHSRRASPVSPLPPQLGPPPIPPGIFRRPSSPSVSPAFPSSTFSPAIPLRYPSASPSPLIPLRYMPLQQLCLLVSQFGVSARFLCERISVLGAAPFDPQDLNVSLGDPVVGPTNKPLGSKRSSATAGDPKIGERWFVAPNGRYPLRHALPLGHDERATHRRRS